MLARDYTYTVDANVTTIDDLLASARTQAFGYDPVDRLTAADGAYGDLGLEYDANANRTALIDDGQRDDYRINFSNNWLLETEAADYRYDNAGNTLEKGADTFSYDTHHRLTEATVDGTTSTYAYNIQHQRVSKSVGGTTTRFFYGQGGELLSEMVVGSGLTAAEYVWLDGRPLAYITNGQVYQVHTDHLGTPQVLTDASGAAAWEAEYRPFGEAGTTGTLSFPLRFPGQYHDAETGLHYNWHRYYDPATGRYLTSDPIGLEGGLNPYAYALSNPTAYTDPTGQYVPLLLGAFAVADAALSTLDAYDTYQTISNECASTSEKWAAGGLFAAGVVLPGNYGWADNVASAIGPTVGELRRAKLKDAHHIIQDAAVRDIPGYKTNSAPGIQLPGGGRGTPHHAANQVQKQRGGGTYAAERRIGYKALRRAGLSKIEARNAIGGADSYFESIGVTPGTKTRVPRRYLPRR